MNIFNYYNYLTKIISVIIYAIIILDSFLDSKLCGQNFNHGKQSNDDTINIKKEAEALIQSYEYSLIDLNNRQFDNEKRRSSFLSLFTNDAIHCIDFKKCKNKINLPISDYLDSLKLVLINGNDILIFKVKGINFTLKNEIDFYSTKTLIIRTPNNQDKTIITDLKFTLILIDSTLKISKVECSESESAELDNKQTADSNFIVSKQISGRTTNCDGEIINVIIEMDKLKNFLDKYEITSYDLKSWNPDKQEFKKNDTVEICISRKKIRYHKVISGENSFQISHEYNIDYQNLKLWNLNKKINLAQIKAGDTLLILNDISKKINYQICFFVKSDSNSSKTYNDPETSWIIKKIKEKIEFGDVQNEYIKHVFNKDLNVLSCSESISQNLINVYPSEGDGWKIITPIISNNKIELIILVDKLKVRIIGQDLDNNEIDQCQIDVYYNSDIIKTSSDGCWYLYIFPGVNYIISASNNYFERKTDTISIINFPSKGNYFIKLKPITINIEIKYKPIEDYNINLNLPQSFRKNYEINKLTKNEQKLLRFRNEKDSTIWKINAEQNYLNDKIKEIINHFLTTNVKEYSIELPVKIKTYFQNFGFSIDDGTNFSFNLDFEIIPFVKNELVKESINPNTQKNYVTKFSYPASTDSIYPAKLYITKPYGYNIVNEFENTSSNWENPILTIDLLHDNYPHFIISKIPDYNFFYIDVSDCSGKIQVIDFFQNEISKISKSKCDFYLFISNGNNPIKSEITNSLDYNQLLNQIIFIDTQLPILNSELMKINNCLKDEQIMSERRSLNLIFFLSCDHINLIYPDLIDKLKRHYNKLIPTIYTETECDTDIKYIKLKNYE